MSSSLPLLIKALDSKRNEMEHLLALLKEEQKSIVEVDIASLENLDSRKRELLQVMERGNTEYRQLLKEIASEMNVEKIDNLSSLLPGAPPALREAMRSQQAKILDLGESLNRIIEFNHGLLNSSLQHVHQNLAFFNSLANKSTTYGDAGNMVAGNGGARLVCKEI